MENILLLEPGYKNKYPPLSLMKIATYHREKGDTFTFIKGDMPCGEVPFDRVYISTLFTFEWDKTKQSIAYALKFVKDPTKIYVGGILATLKPDWIKTDFPDVNVVIGLLNERGKLGYEDDEIIDTLPPDYSILDDVKEQHEYRANAFFTYTTRGCGMNCSFCAVKTLEPQYIPRIRITNQIHSIIERYGSTRDLRNLLLMDNNVLKSPYLREIVDEIKGLGFARGARYINPLTSKEVQRAVDFNQGLDAKLLTQDKANMLGELELKPVRIAFDHILDQESYITAIRRCVRAGLRYFSNYLLFNAENGSSFKGHAYPPDTPEDLYKRLIINIDLQEELSTNCPIGEKVSIYSFPMRYAPLDLPHRKYIGPNWNAKFLRAIQVMLTPTQGKGISGRIFFNAAFGANLDEFRMNLAMPEHILAARGHFVRKPGESIEERKTRRQDWQLNRKLRKEWISLYHNLPDKEVFIQKISNNHFELTSYATLEIPEHKQLFLYYLTEYRFLDFLNNVPIKEIPFISAFLRSGDVILSRLLNQYIQSHNLPYEKLVGYLNMTEHDNFLNITKQLATPEYLRTGKCKWATEIELDEKQVITELGNAWETLYEQMSDHNKYLKIVNANTVFDSFYLLKHTVHKKAVLYHFTPAQVLDLLSGLDSETDIILIHNYFMNQAPFWIDLLAHYLYFKPSSPQIRLTAYIKIFGKLGVDKLLKLWFEDQKKSSSFLNRLQNVFISIKTSYTDIDTLSALHEYAELGIFSHEEVLCYYNPTNCDSYDIIRNDMIARFDEFRKTLLSQIPIDVTSQPLIRAADEYLNKFYKRFLARIV